MTARLVYDGHVVKIPPEMGEPRADQMQGTELEKLVEVAGRKCYESLGAGRPSSSFHKHIREVGHTSILEHAVITFSFETEDVNPWELLGRKGVNVFRDSYAPRSRLSVSANLRAISEWESKTNTEVFGLQSRLRIGRTFAYWANRIYAPQIVEQIEGTLDEFLPQVNVSGTGDLHRPITLYLSGSRAWSHEMIRHRCAVSMLSHRYTDASKTEWVWHPDFDGIDDDTEFGLTFDDVGFWQGHIEGLCKQAYSLAATEIEAKLLSKGVDRTSARKRARSAARGFLGHALRTDMIFTATAQEWLDIIRQRMSPAADPEIAGVIEEARDVLRTSQSGHLFA